MTQGTAVPTLSIPAPIPLREVLPWAVFAGVIMLALLYLVGMDQGRHRYSRAA